MAIALRALSAASHVLPTSRRIIAAFHETPSVSDLASTVDVLVDTVGPVRQLHELVEGADGVALTFDDGDRSIVDIAAPWLAANSIFAHAFVVTGLIGTEDPFWWHEVELRAPEDAARLIRTMKLVDDDRRLEMLAALRESTRHVDVRTRNLTPIELPQLEELGVSVGNHSVSHPLLDQCGDEKVEREITSAHEQLTDWLGHPPDAIAYPNGNVDERSVEVARRLGYPIGLLFDHRPVGRIDDPLRISRVRINVGDPVSTTRARASGLHPWIHHARRRP